MSKQEQRRDKYCELCPCRLEIDTPSPMAMEKIHSMQVKNAKKRRKAADLTEKGCSFAINSSENSYCFWKFAESLTSPVPDKEICQILGINQVQLREHYNSAICKLRSMVDEPDMKEFLNIIIEKIESDTKSDHYNITEEGANTINNPEEDSQSELDILAEIAQIKKRRKGKSNSSQPYHRDGKKVDLYGLGSKKGKDKK